jgi:site-specific recombinase XerD
MGKRRRVAEREPEATVDTTRGQVASVADGTPAVAPAILAPPAIPTAGRPRDENPVLAYLARLSPGSRRTMRASLETIARLASSGEVGALDFPWWMLRYQHSEAIRGRLAEAYAPATANKMLSAMKGVLKSCWRLGLMTADERDRASDVEPVRGTRLPPGRSIPRGELRSLFEACAAEANDPRMRARGVRDAAMLALLYIGGLRRTELASLRLSDYDPDERTVRIRGKGNKERQVFAEGGADLLLASWLELRGNGDPSEPLFLPVRKDGLVQHMDAHGEKKSSLSDQAVYKMVKRRHREAKIKEKRRHREAKIKEVSPHDFRKTFVGDLLDAIGDLSTVQKLAGHSDPATTARYDRRGERAMREAASHLHVPHYFGD